MEFAPLFAHDSHTPSHGVRSQRVLVVDDNRDAAISLSLLLSLTGRDTSTAFDGKDAIDAAVRFDPDVVVLDIGMPKMNGYEVCRLMRRMERVPAFVIIALTGWGLDADRRRSFDAGFDAHLVKPVDPDTLLRTIRECSR
jgi:CheY-like chemotaxis protein